MGKNNSLASKRRVYSYLGDRIIVDKVFNVLAKRYQKRNGGYVRIIKAGFRYGDSAPKAIIELIERDINAKGLDDKNRIKDANEKKDEQQVKSNPQENVSSKDSEKNKDTATKSEKIKDKKETKVETK